MADIYQDLFELSPSPNAVLDTDGRFLRVNRSFIQRFNYPPERLLDGSITLISLFPEPERAQDLLMEICEKQVVRRREVHLQDQGGNPLAMLFSGRALTMDGQPGIEVSLVDISIQKQLERALRQDHARLSSLLEGLTAGLFLVDNEGTITEVNRELGNLLKVEHETIRGQPYHELFARLLSEALEPELLQQSLSQALTAINERPAVEIALGGEPYRYVEVAFFPVWDDDGTAFGWGGLVQDVTEARDRVAWKLELLSILAHDIRAPLATLKGHATALLANYRQWSDAMILEFLEAIDRGTDELARQVDRSLALTRVETGRLGLRPEAVEPVELVHQAVERAAGALKEVRVAFDLPEGLSPVRADPARLEEVLVNLLENAARYTPPDVPILIQGKEGGSHLQLAVTDQGPGVSSDLQKRIFEKYVGNRSKGSGSGLGLFISRRIVEAHGGRIWVESPVKGTRQGASFKFTIPFMPESRTTNGTAKAYDSTTVPPPMEDTARILVVEDEPYFQALIRSVLVEAGYEVELVPDGMTAIDIVKITPPDLVLLDWILPRMDGLSVCRNIRRWTNVPILLVTSKTSLEDLISGLDAGADDYLAKPFQSPELLARIRALLRRRHTLLETEADRFSFEGFTINFDSQEVWVHGERQSLTPTEFQLLALLARHHGQVLTYDQILDHLFDPDGERDRHDLFVHVSRLRKKIEPNPSEPRYILTRWGVGYLFASP